jgi:hypothetical protein
MAACATCALLLGVAQAQAATVVTDSVVSQSTQTQTRVPVTFGQVFKAGDVPANATVLATLNGQSIPLQVDAKATNPDGSLRHAVLTAMVPSLPGGGTLPLALSAGSPSASMANGAPVSLSQLLATGYDAKVSVNLGGVTYSVNARGLLQAADLSGACGPWKTQCDQWLSGPLASEWVVNGPVTSSAGSAYPNLRIYFAVRAYAGGTPGTVASVRTDIIVENTDAFAPQAQPQYTATLSSGSASYTSPVLTQYTATRWHKVLWWNNAEPQVYLQQDTQYIQNSMAVSRYMPLQPDEAFLERIRQTCAPLDHCDQTNNMKNPGAQPGIGPLPRWTSVYIIDPDVRAYNWMLANTDALGTYSIHYRDEATGWPISIQRHPNVTMANWEFANLKAGQGASALSVGYRTDLLPNCTDNAVVTGCNLHNYNTGNPYVWENAHQPAESYVPYMVTGSYYYMSELAFGASQNEAWSNAQSRGYSQGLLDQSHGQVRGKAWTLRSMAEAAWLLPDTYPLKSEFNADVVNSLADFNEKYTYNPNANPLRLVDHSFVFNVNGGKLNGINAWQHNFLTWSADHAAELGFAGAAAFRDWLAPFEIGTMTDWQNNPTHGFCWLEASGAKLQAKDDKGNPFSSYTEMYDATFPTLAGLACNSPEMVAALGKLEGKKWQIGEMFGYAYSATGYPANVQIGLAAAVDSGLPNAADAWSIFESRSVKPDGKSSKDPNVAYRNYPNFAIVPRSAPLSPPITPTQPPINSNPSPVNPPRVNPTPPLVNPTSPSGAPPKNPLLPPLRPNDSMLRRLVTSPGTATANQAHARSLSAASNTTEAPSPSNRATAGSGNRESVTCAGPTRTACGADRAAEQAADGVRANGSRRVTASAIPAEARFALMVPATAVASPAARCGSATRTSNAPTAGCARPMASLWTVRGWLDLLAQARGTLYGACPGAKSNCHLVSTTQP